MVTYDWGNDIVDFIDSVTDGTKIKVFCFPHNEENYRMGLEADYLQVVVSTKVK